MLDLQLFGFSGFILEVRDQREERELPLSLLLQRLVLPEIRNNCWVLGSVRGGRGGYKVFGMKIFV